MFEWLIILHKYCLIFLLISLLLPDCIYSRDKNFMNQYPINSRAFEIIPLVSADGEIIFFCSAMKGNREWAKYNDMNSRYDYDIYFAKKRGNTWDKPVNMGDSINTPEDNAIISISPDGQVVYFLSFKKDWSDDGGPFYKAELRGEKWTNIEGLGGGISEFLSSDINNTKIAGGTISPDGREFYFSTNVNAEYGLFDLWVSRLEDGYWSYPENLGPEVNAAGASNQYPYISFDNKTLYFSSNGFGGYGSGDIVFSVRKDNEWSKPLNVGKPINSSAGESSISIPGSGDIVYLVSDRTERNKTDIFTTSLPREVSPSSIVIVKGTVKDQTTGNPVEALVKIEDLSLGNEVYTSRSNSETGQYLSVLQTGKNYSISVECDNYIFSSDNFMIPTNAAYMEIEKGFMLTPIAVGAKVVVKNFFFDVNKSTLRPESKPELNRAIEFLKKYPDMVIEISGHTDNAGSDQLNMILSEARAVSVKKYLTEVGGIEADRLLTVGYGAQFPIGNNETEAGRQINRRTEFTIKKIK